MSAAQAFSLSPLTKEMSTPPMKKSCDVLPWLQQEIHFVISGESSRIISCFNSICSLQEINNHSWFMVFYTTFNNISVRSWQSVLLEEETGVPGVKKRPVASH
jgi:hypothetical protein